MEIKFCGGAQTVTGSQFLLSVNGSRVLLECGIFQGRRQESYERNINFMFDPSTVNAVLLSHAHMDHSGNIPNLIKKGFTGSIFATTPSVELCKVLLRDSAHLQEMDIHWVNKVRAKHGKPLATVLYNMAEAEASMEHFVPVPYNKQVTVAPGVTATFLDAGHILGSAGILIEVEEKGRKQRIGFAGDIGRPNIPVMHDPDGLRDIDTLIMESTYGNRVHSTFEAVEEDLAEIVRNTAQAGGKILVPSFAVGRTQLIVYLLHKLFDQGRIPEIPIYVDSPMANDVTEIFRQHLDLLDRETQRVFVHNHEDPFAFRRLTYVNSSEESKKLNEITFPAVIISSSGMCEGGRILHHLRNNIENPRNLILFVGYAAKETLARKLIDGYETVKIFGEEHKVKAQIKMLDGFSAHADRRDLIEYVKLTPPERLKQIFLVHGEPDQSIPLGDALRSIGYQNVSYPQAGETVKI